MVNRQTQAWTALPWSPEGDDLSGLVAQFSPSPRLQGDWALQEASAALGPA